MYEIRRLPATGPGKGCGNWVVYPGTAVRESCRNFALTIIKNSPMGFLRQLAEYFYIKKRDPNAPHTKWMKYMHGINRISLFMFILALIIIIIKMLTKK
jgi:hypothetical protein